MAAPIIIGGAGHSGTRIFAQSLVANGVFMGIARVTRHPDSYDLKIINLLSKWVVPYRSGALSNSARAQMQREFRRRLRICLPLRRGLWGFKNPRTVLLLEFFVELFPQMKFLHVVRDGRDMSFGNVFANGSDPHPALFLSKAEEKLSLSERMILYWGRSNFAARDFGQRVLKDRYMMVRFEDLCDEPQRLLPEVLTFAGCGLEKLEQTHALVHKPKSIGRWRTFDPVEVERTVSLGRNYLATFGYQT
jgi:Sulfotransferase family